MDTYGIRCFGEQPLSRPEWVSAASIAQLAGMIGLPADELSRTVARFNDGAKDAVDPDFGRGVSAVAANGETRRWKVRALAWHR